MSSVKKTIPESSADIGGLKVGRLLPSRIQRSIGPFVFMDHFGPENLSAETNLDVPPHPHIGLSTLTYLFDGAIMHRDSLGSVQEIEPGSVNWMTAGKGIVHSERTPEHLRKTTKTLHGLQIWVGLPKDQEQCEPSFSHIPAEQLPVWQDNDMNFKLIAGELFDNKTTVPVYSPLYLLELRTNSKGAYTISKSFYGERGIYILEGSIKIEEETYHKGQILVLSEESDVEIEFLDASAIFVLGGERFAEERYIQWNYVSSELSLIERAIQDWYSRKYPEIPGEYEYNEMLKN